MNFIISANTDIGISKTTNQDSLTVKHLTTPLGTMVFALMCDGMGGLDKGEVASATVIRAFDEWVHNQLPQLCNAPLEDAVEEAPAAEETAEAVTDAMAELYPETVQPAEEAVEAPYTRRRKADEE